jgi:hypothetical protein
MHRITSFVLVLLACAVAPAAAQAGGTLKITKNVAKAGVAKGGGITCGLDCDLATKSVPDDCIVNENGQEDCDPRTVGVSATPEDGWTVTGYGGCTDGGDDFCSVTMAGSQHVSVTFADTGAPTAAIGGPVAGANVRGTIDLSATAADNDAVERVRFYVDGAEVGEDLTAPYAIAVNTAGIADGTHTFSAKSFDSAGHESSASTRSLVVDNTKPTVAFTGGTGAGALVGSPGNVSFGFAGTDGTSGVSQLQCALDGGALVTCDSTTGHAIAGVAEGAQKFLVRAIDAAGNVGDFAQRSFTVDTTAPSVAIKSGPADDALVGKPGSATYAFQIGDLNGLQSVTCAVDGAFGACTKTGEHTLSGLADGPHTFSIKAIDNAGNQRVVTRDLIVDTTAPAITFTAGPAAGAVLGQPATATFEFTIADATPGMGAVECELDGVASSCDSIGAHELESLAHGEHTFTVRATDVAGNTGSGSRTFSVDLAAPETKIDTASTGAAAAFTFSSSEPGSTFKCRLYAEGATPPAFGDCVGASGSHSTSGLAVGAYVFEVVATDAVGNTDASPATKAFTVTAQKPGGGGGDGGGTGGGGTGGGGTGGGTTDGGTKTVTTTVTTTTTTNGVEKVDANADWKWHRLGRRTKAIKLNVRDIPQGATVEVLCNGKGCPFKKKSLAYKRSSLKLAAVLEKRRVAAGGTIEIRVVKPNAIGWVIAFKMLPRALPAYKVLCLPVGATAPAAC